MENSKQKKESIIKKEKSCDVVTKCAFIPLGLRCQHANVL
jgi:hypothetical protein